MPDDPVVRTPLLTAFLAGTKTVERVEVRQIRMAPGLASGLHLHPCPVIGIVTEGSVLFQVEGQEGRVLKPGDAFFEPANVEVPHFDALEEGAAFVAHYLLGPGESELIRMLEQRDAAEASAGSPATASGGRSGEGSHGMRILFLSGSLRAVSSNTTLLHAAALLAPPAVEVDFYHGIGDLPHFNPDLDRGLDDPDLPPAVCELRARVGRADALLISSPEYAHGVPGSLKNALDWLVGSSEFPGKPVALVNASPASTHAQVSLAETLRTMSAEVVEGSPFLAPLAGKRLDAAGAAADPEIAGALRAALAALGAAVGR
jgi:NAD(P)H-dependent FMN reductase/quercetin dioxygenase-like cupin family protein